MRCALLLELGFALLKQPLVLLHCLHQGLMGTCSMLQRSFPAGYVLQQKPMTVETVCSSLNGSADGASLMRPHPTIPCTICYASCRSPLQYARHTL